ncbi:MAG: site-specific integrase [Armatimonadetes bacterium]|nr:site-specific integrase [Armatimonadota bacterium]
MRLFLSVNRGGRAVLDGPGLSGQAVAKVMAKRAVEAGVGSFSPHDCRRTYGSKLLDNGVDISTAAVPAGQASVETTGLDDRPGKRSDDAAAGLSERRSWCSPLS